MFRVWLALVALGALLWRSAALQQLQHLKREWRPRAVPSGPLAGGPMEAHWGPPPGYLPPGYPMMGAPPGYPGGAALVSQELSHNAPALSERLATLGNTLAKPGRNGIVQPPPQFRPRAVSSPLVLLQPSQARPAAALQPAFYADPNTLSTASFQTGHAWGAAAQLWVAQEPPRQWRHLPQPPQAPPVAIAQTASLASLVQLARAMQAPPQASGRDAATEAAEKPTADCDNGGDEDGKLQCGPLNWFFSLDYSINSMWMMMLFWLCSCCCVMPVLGYLCFFSFVNFA